MNLKRRIACVVVGFLLLALSVAAQTASGGSASAQVPPMIQFSSVAIDEGGNSLSGVISLTFSLYAGQQGGEPLWTETQNNVQLDATGHYSVELGITKPNGVPTALFTTGEARWLGVQIAQQPEQPRVLLLSVPYALKAGDAATIGGLPPSAFVLAAPAGNYAAESVATASATSGVNPSVGGSGTEHFIPLWIDNAGDLGNSILFESVNTLRVGINTTTPATTLDVNGSTRISGAFALPSDGNATQTVGATSFPLYLSASSFNNSTRQAVTQHFVLQAEPTDNNSPDPSGTLNLLFGSGSNNPTETGLSIASTGILTFNPEQTFPNTVSAVNTASGSGLMGGGASSLDLSLINTCAASQVLEWSGAAWVCANLSGGGTITGVTAGTDLTGGGTSGNVTLNLNTTALNSSYAQLAANNTFTGNQTVNGNLSATGVVTGSSFQIASNLFDYGSYANGNAFLGFAGNPTMAGQYNTASGYQALLNNTGYDNAAYGAFALQNNQGSNTNGSFTGSGNTAIGAAALSGNTTGNSNTATGDAALIYSTGNNNTALGFVAGPDPSTPTLNNSTAIGAYADVTQNNSLVLGSIYNTNGCTTANNCADTMVGIGTTAPTNLLTVVGDITNTSDTPVAITSPSPYGTWLALGNTSTGSGSGSPGGLTWNIISAGPQNLEGAGNLVITNLTPTNGPFNTVHMHSNLLVDGAITGPVSIAGNLTVTGSVTCGSGCSGGTGGSGTVTSVGTSLGLIGGPITNSGTLSIDPNVVPQLGAASNTFNGSVTAASLAATGAVAGSSLTASGPVTGSSFQIGANLFDYGSYANGNAFLGFAGNSTMAGLNNTASGYQALFNNAGSAVYPYPGSGNTATGVSALYLNTTGSYNAATGVKALYANATGSYNAAIGDYALQYATGSSNTALGYSAGPDTNTPNLNNSTAIGAFADVTQSNSLVLGSILTLNYCTAANNCATTKVGIGTTAPQATLDVEALSGTPPPTVNFGQASNPATFTVNGITNITGSLSVNGQQVTGGGGGGGTVTSVATGTGLTGGPITGSGTLAIDQTVVPLLGNNLNAFTGSITAASFTGNGAGLTNVNAATLAGLSPTGFATTGSNTFIGNQTVNGNITATATAQGGNGTLTVNGYNGVSGTGQGGGGAIYAQAGHGDETSGSNTTGGTGGVFIGGYGTGYGGDGIDAYAGGGDASGTAIYAGKFVGNLDVTGSITAGTKDFKIDHPLDPANKYLFHASVESSEMMNIYTGNVTTDAQGDARIELPDWFEAVNTDFRYQLTVIGQFAQAIVSRKVANHQFSVKTDKPNVEVSWQITGVRQDAYAKAHPLVVEQEKDARERGHYIHPELYGASEEQSVEWARHPEMMKRIEETRARQIAAAQQ